MRDNKKFELTSETKVVLGKTLYRIKALMSFGSVSKGDKGGWIEKESNLSVYGNAWVSGDAWVFGNAEVFGNARVFGKARVSGDARVSGYARVSGDAEVSGNAWVSGDAEVFGNAMVFGNAEVSGNAEKMPITITGLSYLVTITDSHIKIGCEFHSTKEWEGFSDSLIKSMDGERAIEFWSQQKQTIIDLAKSHQISVSKKSA